ncbi:hypothetical protein K435DRAFT_802898 [Dendrothele bispora CBS 962.96]|uniref:Uncharacterized protein n=1 Tax=Dendrothele bispora (strain CBS 962.96) TaxID=1314807 RepID=A0A4V6T583_DENBC|nr:hypothetical protein K435DRAFT_802898 [Dendrothele bispora CBS 962.96]
MERLTENGKSLPLGQHHQDDLESPIKERHPHPHPHPSRARPNLARLASSSTTSTPFGHVVPLPSSSLFPSSSSATKITLRPSTSVPGSGTTTPALAAPRGGLGGTSQRSEKDPTNFKLGQNQTELSRQIVELTERVEKQGQLIHKLAGLLEERVVHVEGNSKAETLLAAVKNLIESSRPFKDYRSLVKGPTAPAETLLAAVGT